MLRDVAEDHIFFCRTVPSVKPSPVVRFIVNADDLGMSDAVNEAIFDGMAVGVVTSSTILAAGPAAAAAVERARSFPQASFGVHLNLSSFRPLAPSADLRAILNEDGSFHEHAIRRVGWSARLVNAIATEWEAQVKWVIDAGINVSHLDGHHHVHMLPGLFPALKRVQRRFGLRRVRGTWNIYDREHAPARLLRLQKRLWLAALRGFWPTRTTDALSDFLMFLRAVDEGVFASGRWPRTIELMVHPNGIEAESGEEARALRSNWLDRLPCAATLVSYQAI